MKFIEPNVKYLDIKDADKKIEIAGRTCYNSLDKVSEYSYVFFIDNLLKNGHTSVLEHSNITIFYPLQYLEEYQFLFNFNISKKPESLKFFKIIPIQDEGFLISANVRAWLNYYKEWTQPKIGYLFRWEDKKIRSYFTTLANVLCFQSIALGLSFSEYHALGNIHFRIIKDSYKYAKDFSQKVWDNYINYCKIYSFELTTNRGITHELVRHRICSFSQMSTRYINYNAQKYGSELTFCINDDNLKKNLDASLILSDALKTIEQAYMTLIQYGLKTDSARTILPNATMAKLIMSGTSEQWDSVFKLRCDSHAHFEIRALMEEVRNQLQKIKDKLTSPIFTFSF